MDFFCEKTELKTVNGCLYEHEHGHTIISLLHLATDRYFFRLKNNCEFYAIFNVIVCGQKTIFILLLYRHRTSGKQYCTYRNVCLSLYLPEALFIQLSQMFLHNIK